MAKRRRINIKFVVIAAMILVLGLGTAFVLMKTVFKPNPQKYMALAQQNIASQDWESAVKNLSTAIKYSRHPDPGPWIMLANALNHLSAKDPAEYVQQYRGALHHALSIDPSNKDAISQLLEYHMDVAEAGGRMASNYEQITKFATRLKEIDPADKRAEYAIHFATLDQWLNGSQTDPKLVGDAEDKLTQLLTT
ncbi:MAG: hypothetical protein H7Z14_14835, partial [Anaerolineae bacterium]|nr:hypothetical protein [Phycisphaerae bacterium]